MQQDPRVDAYIARAAPFAQPILNHLRAVVRRAAPDLTEDIKWSMPMWLHSGRIVANMAAFKAHASFGTWRRDAGSTAPKPDGMGQVGKIVSLSDLPPDAKIAEMVQAAVALLDAGGKLRPASKPRSPAEVPGDLQAALDADPLAATAFAGFPAGARREYVDWVVQAKQPATRAKRIATTVAQSAEGRRLNWKYENC